MSTVPCARQIADLNKDEWTDVTHRVHWESSGTRERLIHGGQTIALLVCGGSHAVVFAPREDGGKAILIYQKNT